MMSRHLKLGFYDRFRTFLYNNAAVSQFERNYRNLSHYSMLREKIVIYSLNNHVRDMNFYVYV